MQVKHFAMAALIAVTGFISCSKKSDKKYEFPIEGTWVGKSSILSEPYNSFYSFKIKAGGLLEVLDASQQKIGEGMWQLDESTFSATYDKSAPDNNQFSVLGIFDKETGELDGTWGHDQNEYGGGYWYMYPAN